MSEQDGQGGQHPLADPRLLVAAASVFAIAAVFLVDGTAATPSNLGGSFAFSASVGLSYLALKIKRGDV